MMLEDIDNVVNASALKILKDVVNSDDTLSDAQLGKVLRTVLQKTENEIIERNKARQEAQEEEAKRQEEDMKLRMHYLAMEEDLNIRFGNRMYGTDYKPMLQEYLIKDENNNDRAHKARQEVQELFDDIRKERYTLEERLSETKKRLNIL